MSVAYRAVQWNRHKVVYDVIVVVVIACVVLGYVAAARARHSGEEAISEVVLAIRGSAVAGLALLHVTLAIGPLARLTRWGSALLYNRRHLGVMTFVVCLFHATLATMFYGAFGDVLPIVAILRSGDVRSVSGFPFEWLGFAALLILAMLAATSHDFWLRVLTPGVWKWLHMAVYVAYALIVLHVVTGALQSERDVAWGAALLAGCVTLACLHAAAAWKQRRVDAAALREEAEWMAVARCDEFEDGRAKIVCSRQGASIAVFRQGEAFHAIANVCVHQGGPLGEGEIIGGCVTCPWHGYQFVPATGASPPPFTDRVARYEVRIEGDVVQVCGAAREEGVKS
ncbi:MAG TPA: Rieske 2Fe-2S domain-containing protein [Phycisphaerales bacterium]|nr:Rieske 2Fe-2S domain-containing protein [Phycisphaerales bacterium]